MIWEDYRATYVAFDTGICQTEIIVTAADTILDDFPENLPAKWKEDIDVGLDSYYDMVEEALDKIDDGGIIKLRPTKDLKSQFERDSSGLLKPLIDVYTKLSVMEYPLDEISFSKRAYYQQLVMIFSHLDSFIADSLRTICKVKPEVLKSRKKIDWDTVINADSLEEVKEEIVEKFVYQFGWEKVVDRVEKMEQDFGLDIPISQNSLDVVEIAESGRNLVTHDGGKINQEYIDLIKRITGIQIDQAAIGQSMNISKEEVHRYSESVRMIGGAIYAAISKKYFDKKEEKEIIPYRKDPNLKYA
jgi:hypothetical protein